MTANPAAFSRVLARTALRLRLQRGIRYAALCCAVTALFTTGWTLTVRSPRLGSMPVAPLALVACCTLIALALGAALPVARTQLAEALDRAGELRGRVRAAFAFEQLPREARSAFMNAAIADAYARGALVSTVAAAPYHVPRAAGAALISLLACLLASTWATAALPSGRPQRHSAPASFVHGLSADDFAAFRDGLAPLPRSLERGTASLEARSAWAETRRAYELVLAQLEAGALSSDAAVLRLLALERALAAHSERATQADERALSEFGQAFSAANEELGRSLPANPEQAARELRKLSETLRSGELGAREREQLARALDAARAREREQNQSEARREQLESLLARPSTSASAGGEPSLLESRQRESARRELDQLRRRADERRTLHRELARLSRELAGAREALSGEHEHERQAGDSLARAADALERFAAGQRDEAQRRALERELSQLRELLSQRPRAAGPSSGGQRAEQQASERRRRERFDARARGMADAGSTLALSAREGRGGSARPSDGDQRSNADAGARALTLAVPSSASGGTPGDAPSDLPSSMAGELAMQGTDGEQRKLSEAPAQAGDGHDETRERSRPRTRLGYEDQQLGGARGRGPTRSQVIAGAAEAGFARAAYRKVFSEYRAHAEELIAHDEIPAGYRFHVRRYFQLVRPRDGEEAP
jgi:hypothetical protein